MDRSFEQIKVSFGYQKLGLNLVVIGSGVEYPYHGVTHHSYGDGIFIKTIENSSVFNPGSYIEFEKLFRDNYANGNINIFRATTQPHHQEIDRESINSGKVIRIAQGEELTIIVTGGDLDLAVDSAKALNMQGISVEILYVHTLKPLDTHTILESINRTKRFISIERQSSFGGLFSDISSAAVAAGLDNIKGRSIDLGVEYSRNYGTYFDHSERLGFTKENLSKLALEIL